MGASWITVDGNPRRWRVDVRTVALRVFSEKYGQFRIT